MSVAGGRSLTALVLAVILGPLAASCAKPRAYTEPEIPPLAAPPPPPRALPPLESGPIEAAATPERLQPVAPVRPPARPRPESARNGEGGARESRIDAPRAETAVEPPRPPVERDPSSMPVLQLAPGGGGSASEESIRHQLVRAAQNLNRVDYGALNADARAQYDTAKRFMTLAEQAIRDRNLIFAQTLADKAVVIATVLLKR